MSLACGVRDWWLLAHPLKQPFLLVGPVHVELVKLWNVALRLMVSAREVWQVRQVIATKHTLAKLSVLLELHRTFLWVRKLRRPTRFRLTVRFLLPVWWTEGIVLTCARLDIDARV